MSLKKFIVAASALACLGACVSYDVAIPTDRAANTLVSPELRQSVFGAQYWTDIESFGAVPDALLAQGQSVCGSLDNDRFTHAPTGYHPNVIANNARTRGFFCSRTNS